MAVETMERRAADNKYLHREFHNFFNLGLIYVKEKYGEDGVREYLETFTRNFYSPLMDEIKANGLVALEDHFKKIYEIEESSDKLTTKLEDGRLEVYISECPAIAYIKSTGRPLSDLYSLSSTVVFGTIARECGLGYECLSYNDETGEARHLFTKEA